MSDFRPSSPLDLLRRRADLLECVRRFFSARGVFEVETPLLCQAGAVEAHIDPIEVPEPEGSGTGGSRWLVSSPELCMKRLLAAGSGPIYQITRAFRAGERGTLHNPEFTILEWYRPGFNLTALEDEIEELVVAVWQAARGCAPPRPFERLSYREVFERELGIDPLEASPTDLRAVAAARDIVVPESLTGDDRDEWLNLLLARCIEDRLGRNRPTFVDRYPASQAALARLSPDDSRVAERVELYVEGVELSNGYHELTDPTEQRRRFEAANEERRALGKPELPIDERFLAALEAGLPDTSGVAVGLDRLFLVALGAERLDDVLAFPWERA